MKYKAVIETDDYEDFEFFEDGNGKYLHGIDAGAVNNEWILLYFTECEQETILDKIRAEIEAKCCITVGRENDGAITLYDVFEIIDKYKTEGSDKEC